MRFRGSTKAACAAIAVLLGPSAGLAYCVQHTCEDAKQVREGEPLCHRGADGCVDEGYPLSYLSTCFTFGVSTQLASDFNLSADELDDIVKEAFATWTTADCGGGDNPGISVKSVGPVDADDSFFCKPAPELNLGIWVSKRPWPHDPAALGYTSSTYDVANGKVYDADVDVNTQSLLDRFDQDELPTVLLALATHEAGHYLGLAHSEERDAVMFARYSDEELLMRSGLDPDDADGICALYPPDPGLKCSTPGFTEAALEEDACEDAANMISDESSESCAVQPAGRSGRDFPGWVAALGALAAFGWSRRARRPRGPAARGL